MRAAVAGVVLGMVMATSAAAATITPPAVARPDPYLWLEDVSSPRALAWVDAENARTVAVFESDPRYKALYADALKILEATDRIPTPRLVGGAVTNFWQDPGHVRGIWRTTSLADYRATAPAWTTVLDLDALTAAEKANWVWAGITCEPIAETRCLIALSDGGEDATTEREFDLRTKAFVPGGFVLPTSKQTAAWESADSLLVARDWGAGSLTKSGYPFIIKRLARGAPLSAAVEVFRGQPADVSARPLTLVDGAGHRRIVISRSPSFFESEYFLLNGTKTVRIDAPLKSNLVGLLDDRLIFRNEADWPVAGRAAIPAGSIVAVDPSGKTLPEVVLTTGPRQAIESVEVARGSIIAAVFDNVRGRAFRLTHGPAGWHAERLMLPDNASVGLVSADRFGDEVFLSVQSYLTPPTVWLASGGSTTPEKLKTLTPRFDATGLVTEQFEAVSKDGTRVPYFITHRRDLPLDGSTPTILNAYGGFQASSNPAYATLYGKLWLERGGAFAVANIRGGGEFGPAWHEAALRTNRQRAYDDFFAVGEDMTRRKLTSPRRLGINGGSNGGLLMGVAMTQRPDLWQAINIDVPLLDMLRIEKIAAGASWVGEYGSVSEPDIAAFWTRVSPYNALTPGVAYPVPYIFTTTKDDRVGPVHARKFAARMKEYRLPYYFYENTEGGHGAGANLKQRARTMALEIVYFSQKLMDGTPAAPVAMTH